MKFFILFILSVPSWALSNAVTIQEKSGSTQTNRVVTIPRYFANKEVCLNPRPYSGGSAVTYWQADVKNRWPVDSNCVGGYAKFALITIEIPSLSGNGTYVVEFRSDAAAASSGSGLTAQQMLDFDTGGGVGSWGAKITTAAAGGFTDSISARDMIASGYYQVIESGPLRTSVIVREGPDAVNSVLTRGTSFGYQCTSNCAAPYASATWLHDPSYASIRPSFEITFYSPHTGTGYVEEGNILDNAWMDRYQDQRLSSFVIYNGLNETNACYTAPIAFVFPAGTRLYETCGDATPGAVNIDFNKAYVMYSKVLLAYSLDLPTGAAATALEVADFNATDKGTTIKVGAADLGWGQTIRGSAAGASSPILGWMPRWSTRYITSGFDYTMVAVILGNAKANMHAPYTFLESRTNTVFHTGDVAKAFGRVASIDARTNWSPQSSAGVNNADGVFSPSGQNIRPNIACPAPTSSVSGGCMVTCSGNNYWCSRYAAGGTTWSFDNAHSDNEFFLPYLFTGKRVYLEGLWTIAALHIAYEPANDPPADWAGRWGNRGIILDPFQNPRGSTWPLRNLGQAVVLSDDGSVEKTYFLEKLNNNLEMHEGRQMITNGDFAPTNPSWLSDATVCTGFNKVGETSLWHMGRCFYDIGFTNPLHIPAKHYFPGSGYGNGSYTGYGADLSLTGDAGSAWTEVYWLETLASLRDWGLKATGLHTAASKYFIHMFGDPARTDGNPARSFLQWQPNMQTGLTGFIQTWAAMKNTMIVTEVLSKAIDAVSTTLSIANSFTDVVNEMHFNTKAFCFFQIGTEIIQVTAGSTGFVAATTATTANLATTSIAHSLATGQIVRIRAITVIDPGMVGDSSCHVQYAGGPKNNSCTFYVKVISPTVIEFYRDAALTNKVTLSGGGSFYTLFANLNIVRGVHGTIATTHAIGDVLSWYPSQQGTWDDSDPSGGHGFYYIAGLSTVVDYDGKDTAEGNGVTIPAAGQTITGKRVFDIVSQVVRNQNWQGGNVSCSGLTVLNCDNSQWSIRPRPLIRNVRVVPNTTSVKFYYTAPDANIAKIAVSTTPFTSTDDSGDTSDAQNNLGRSFTVTGLSSGTIYYYRITAGPLGGAARISGTFVTL